MKFIRVFFRAVGCAYAALPVAVAWRTRYRRRSGAARVLAADGPHRARRAAVHRDSAGRGFQPDRSGRARIGRGVGAETGARQAARSSGLVQLAGAYSSGSSRPGMAGAPGAAPLDRAVVV